MPFINWFMKSSSHMIVGHIRFHTAISTFSRQPKHKKPDSHFNQLPGHCACYGVPLLRCNIHFEQLPKTLWMLPSKRHFNQPLGHYGCYVVRSSSSNLEDTLDATFQQPFESTSSTLWMLRCNIQFEQLGRSLGCYVPTAISINLSP